MEKSNNPEREFKLTDECEHCGEEYELTNQNTALRLFYQQPEGNYLFAVHEECGGQTKIYICNETTQQALDNGIEAVGDNYMDAEEYQAYMEIYEIKLIESHELTPRQDRFCKYFKYLLDNNLIDVLKDKWI